MKQMKQGKKKHIKQNNTHEINVRTLEEATLLATFIEAHAATVQLREDTVVDIFDFF